MKDFIKFFSIITGVFRMVVTILYLLGIIFVILVDADLLVAFFDILGFTNMSTAIIKPILIVALIIIFIINFVITRHIFKAGETGRYHLSNLIFALLFLAFDALIFIFIIRRLETPLMYVFFILNGLLAINSLIGLIARSRGIYQDAIIINESYGEDQNLDDIEKDDELIEDAKEIDGSIKLEFESDDDKDKIIVSSDNKDDTDEVLKEDHNKSNTSIKRIARKKELKTDKKTIKASKKTDDRENQKPVLIKKDTVNKISYQNCDLNDNTTYDDKYVDDIKKKKEEKIFDKPEFVKEDEVIDEDQDIKDED